MSKSLADFKDVEDLTDVTKDDLNAAIEDGYNLLDPILDVEAPTAAQVAQAKEAHAEIKRLEARLAEIEAQDALIATEMDAMRAERATAKTVVEVVEEVVEETAEVIVEETVVEETVETVETVEAVEVTPEIVEAVEVAPERELVTASSAPAKTAGRRPVAPPKENIVDKPKVLIRAAADTGVRPAGDSLDDLLDVAKIATHRFGQLRGGGSATLGIASFQRPVEAGFDVTDAMSDEQMEAAFEHAVDESRLAGGSLTAAANGWCAPLETIWDICDGGSTEGLWDIPGMRVSRGGVRYLKAVDYSSLYAVNTTPGTTAAGWYYTEANVIAGTKKVCIEVPCPAFTDLVLDAAGICVTSSLLTSTAFPEWVRKFLREALIAHEVNVMNALLAKAITAAGTKLVATDMKSTTVSTLDVLDLIIEGQRQKHRWGRQTLEVAVPSWVRGAIRADLALRTGVDLLRVSDADIASYFATRHARVQFVLGFEPLPANAVVYPKTFTALIYKAGSFVKLFQPIINLGVTYDSTLLAVNKATQMFTEEGIALMEKCYGATAVTIPVCSGGKTGAADTDACLVAAP